MLIFSFQAWLRVIPGLALISEWGPSRVSSLEPASFYNLSSTRLAASLAYKLWLHLSCTPPFSRSYFVLTPSTYRSPTFLFFEQGSFRIFSLSFWNVLLFTTSSPTLVRLRRSVPIFPSKKILVVCLCASRVPPPSFRLRLVHFRFYSARPNHRATLVRCVSHASFALLLRFERLQLSLRFLRRAPLL